MRIFDVSDYTLPTFDSIDWQKTKEQVGIFLRAYKVNRERVGLPIFPKLTSECFLVLREDPIKEKWKVGQDLSVNEKEYLKTEACFAHAFTAIMHPYRPEITERRRRVFFYRYFYGLSVVAVSERINYQKNIIIDDSKMAMLQFALALDLLFYR
ncbi:transcriptional regulator, ArpU family protein [Enterococcus faecalis]|nr:transcriptional regulator, ArpU family protein [Enterococcus faecalis]